MTVEFSPEFMKSRLLDFVPPETDVILLGENHRFIFHKKYFSQQFDDLQENKAEICFESTEKSGRQLENLLDVIGDKPEYMQYHWDYRNNKKFDSCSNVSAVFPYLDKDGNVKENKFLSGKLRTLNLLLDIGKNFKNIHKKSSDIWQTFASINTELADSYKYNTLPYYISPYSTIQIYKSVIKKGIKYSCIDSDKYAESSDVSENVGLRNSHMAQRITNKHMLHKNVKFYYGGSAHLNLKNLCDKRTEHGRVTNPSLQSLLQSSGLKTFSIAMETPGMLRYPSTSGTLFKNLSEIDMSGYAKSRSREVYEQVGDEKKEVFVDMRKFVNQEHVGVHVPDMIMVFPEECRIWEVQNYPALLTHERSPMTEADMWHRMDRDFNLKP